MTKKGAKTKTIKRENNIKKNTLPKVFTSLSVSVVQQKLVKKLYKQKNQNKQPKRREREVRKQFNNNKYCNMLYNALI